MLADVLREQLHLVGEKRAVMTGEDCGACSVLCDGKVIPSRTTLLVKWKERDYHN